jgi:TPR repeat
MARPPVRKSFSREIDLKKSRQAGWGARPEFPVDKAAQARRIDKGNPEQHPSSVASEPSNPLPAPRLPVFAICCWALALMAMSQLLVAGMALATRLEESRVERIVVKEVPKLIAVRVPAAPGELDRGSSVVSRPPVSIPAPPPVASLPPVAPTPLTTPQVGDPRSERMVNEARQARVAGDMGLAIVKLEEALSQSPDDPNVHYELGLVHEQMGVFDTAAAHFEKVFQMGVSGAGSLYALAAGKLRDGFEQPDAMVGKLALGRVRIFNDPKNEAGQRVILTIPVQKAPTEEIDVAEIAVSVIFFNRTSKGEIVQLDDKSWVTEQWATLPFDWAGGEESLRMTYVIPPQDGQTEHLFGARTYYGQVVSLLYKGEILDVQAWPRDLAARIPRSPAVNMGDPILPEFQDTLPPGFDPSLPLLPPLPSK